MSTGPHTPEGKAVVALNSVTHGLRTAAIVIPGHESQEDWERFRDDVRADLAPVGAIEEALALRVAEVFWRLRRATRAEQQDIISGIRFEERARADNARTNNKLVGTAFEGVFDPNNTRPASYIPSSFRFDQLLRYEASLSRQLYKALHELEARRDRREGRHTPVARVEIHAE